MVFLKRYLGYFNFAFRLKTLSQMKLQLELGRDIKNWSVSQDSNSHRRIIFWWASLAPLKTVDLSGFTFVALLPLTPQDIFPLLFAVTWSNLSEIGQEFNITNLGLVAQSQGPFYPCSFSIIRDWKLFCFLDCLHIFYSSIH